MQIVNIFVIKLIAVCLIIALLNKNLRTKKSINDKNLMFFFVFYT
jgi:hypothetical protein